MIKIVYFTFCLDYQTYFYDKFWYFEFESLEQGRATNKIQTITGNALKSLQDLLSPSV